MNQRTFRKYMMEIEILNLQIEEYNPDIFENIYDDVSENLFLFHLEDYEYLLHLLTIMLTECERGEYYEMCIIITQLKEKIIKYNK